MPDIVLATLNAKYPHAAFGLRYLMANLAPAGRADRAVMLEFDINQRPLDVVEAILAQNFRRPPTEDLPKPRLGQSTWGFGRGAAPPLW